MIATSKPFSSSTQNAADQAAQEAQEAQGAIGATQQALSSLSDRVEDGRSQAVPVLNRVAAKAEELARRGKDVVRDRSELLKDRAYRASDATRGYIKDEPVKSILIAVAAGAALMALVSLLTRERRY